MGVVKRVRVRTRSKEGVNHTASSKGHAGSLAVVSFGCCLDSRLLLASWVPTSKLRVKGSLPAGDKVQVRPIAKFKV